MFESLKTADLPKLNSGLIRKPTNTRPAIWLVEDNGIRAVVKDFSTNGFLFRNLVGRFLIWREKKAYLRLRGLKGVPRLYGVIEGIALVIEEIQGRNVEFLEDRYKIPPTFYSALDDLVYSFHKRGMAHCDLKRAPNIIVGNDGEPYVVDWSASISARECRFFPLNIIYRQFVLDDSRAIIKLKMRHSPEMVTDHEKIEYRNISRGEKLFRPIRDRLRKILKKIA